MIALHEIFTLSIHEPGALAPKGLGHQETLGIPMIQGRRMKLDVFRVDDFATRPICHGDTVTAGSPRVGGVQVQIAYPAGGDNYRGCEKPLNIAGVRAKDIGSQYFSPFVFLLRVAAVVGIGNKIHGEHAIMETDGIDFSSIGREGILDDPTGLIFSVENAPKGVGAFPGEVIFTIVQALESHPGFINQQILNDFWTFFGDDCHRLKIVDAAACGHDIFSQQFRIVIDAAADYASLGPPGVVSRTIRTFAEYADTQAGFTRHDGAGQSRHAGTDNQDIEVLSQGVHRLPSRRAAESCASSSKRSIKRMEKL
jgi:hypothetical protein